MIVEPFSYILPAVFGPFIAHYLALGGDKLGYVLGARIAHCCFVDHVCERFIVRGGSGTGLIHKSLRGVVAGFSVDIVKMDEDWCENF